MLLKIYAADEIFGKICLRAIRATFFSNMRSLIRGGKGDWGWYPTEGKVQTFSLSGGFPPTVPFLIVISLSLYKGNSEEWLVCLLSWFWKEWLRLFYFKATNLQHVMLNMNKRWHILWWHSVYWRLSIIFKVRSI